IKSSKDAQGVTQTAGKMPDIPQVPSAVAAKLPSETQNGKKVIKPHFSQVFMQEEGAQIDQVIDVAKFQNFILTLALGITYVVLLWQLPKPGYPNLDLPQGQGNILWLLGISHAGYLGGKLPTKA